jgi:hypothetical protein
VLAFLEFILLAQLLPCTPSGLDQQLEDSFVPIQSILISLKSTLRFAV